MGRRRITDPKSSTSQMIKALESLGHPRSKTLLAQRGMRVYLKEELTKRCYLCKSHGSLDNQLIPRWISKETVVSICVGCYQRSAGWVKVDKPVVAWDWCKSNSVEITTALLL